MLNYFEFGPEFQEEMSFQDISYLELWQPLCSMEQNHLFNFGKVLQQEMPFNAISYLELWWPLYSADRKDLCSFGRRHHEERFCEITLTHNENFTLYFVE